MKLPIVLLIPVVAVLLAGCTAVMPPSGNATGEFCGKIPGEMTAQQVGEKVAAYIKPAINPGVNVLLKDVREENGLYKVTIEFSAGTQKEDSVFYASKDGVLLFTQLMNMSVPLSVPEQEPFDAPNADKPDFKFFVMSFCPYGQQAEAAALQVHRLLGDKATFSPHYVIYDNTYYKGQEASYCVQDNATGLYYCSMHGLNELREDMRQLCIFRDYGIGTFFNYTAQINNGCKLSEVDTCWKPIAGNSSINATAVEACVESDGLALVKAEKALDDRFGIGGSPSIVINDAVYDGSRAANDLKEALCTGFNSKPSECSQTVSDTGQQAQGGCGN